MNLSTLIFALYAVLLATLLPSPAQAYLVPLLGLLGTVGGMVAVVITAVFGAIFMTVKLLRAPKDDEEKVTGSDADIDTHD